MTKPPKNASRKKKLGRPRMGKEAAKTYTFRLTAEFMARIEKWGVKHGIANRGEIVRALIEKALRTKD